MSTPTTSQLHVNSLLTEMSVGFMQDAASFVADRVFPRIDVAKQIDRYMKFSRADFFRADMQVRPNGGESAGGGFRMSNDNTYAADVWALHKDVSEQDRANADIDIDTSTVMYLTQQHLLRREIEFKDAAFTTGVWAADLQGGVDFTQFDDAAADPIVVLKQQIRNVQLRTGMKANRVTIQSQVWDVLSETADVLDKIKYTQRAVATEELVASLLGVEQVLVAAGVQDAGSEDVAEDNTPTFIMPKAILVSFAPRVPSRMIPAAGYMFNWSGLTGQQEGVAVSDFYLPQLKSTRYEIEAAYDFKVTAPEAGVYLYDVVA